MKTFSEFINERVMSVTQRKKAARRMAKIARSPATQAKRKKAISRSLLDQISGIGSIRKRAILNHFGSARAVESASLDEIKSVEGVEEKVAKKIYNFFHE